MAHVWGSGNKRSKSITSWPLSVKETPEVRSLDQDPAVEFHLETGAKDNNLCTMWGDVAHCKKG